MPIASQSRSSLSRDRSGLRSWQDSLVSYFGTAGRRREPSSWAAWSSPWSTFRLGIRLRLLWSGSWRALLVVTGVVHGSLQLTGEAWFYAGRMQGGNVADAIEKLERAARTFPLDWQFRRAGADLLTALITKIPIEARLAHDTWSEALRRDKYAYDVRMNLAVLKANIGDKAGYAEMRAMAKAIPVSKPLQEIVRQLDREGK